VQAQVPDAYFTWCYAECGGCALLHLHRAGTGVVVASLYYQSANKAKDGKGSHKEPAKPSGVVYRSASGIKTTSAPRTSFAGVGQVPRSTVGQDEDALESAALLGQKPGAEQ
jgi:hypothetical protein